MLRQQLQTLTLCVLTITCICEPFSLDHELQEKTPIDKIHLVFSNHLDVGYHRGYEGPSCAWNEACYVHAVLNEYWHYYWPLAVDIASRINNNKSNDYTFQYMTFPYMLSLYLDCPKYGEKLWGLKCPTQSEIDYLLNGFKNGYIWLNAFPFNSQCETYDSLLMEFGIKLSRKLMNITGLPSDMHSNVISQRDVPGLPRNFIPVLNKNGIRAVSVGANGGEKAIGNGTKIFHWIDPNTNEKTLILYHAGGYGGFKISDALIIPGFNQALIYAWNGGMFTKYNSSKQNPVYFSF